MYLHSFPKLPVTAKKAESFTYAFIHIILKSLDTSSPSITSKHCSQGKCFSSILWQVVHSMWCLNKRWLPYPAHIGSHLCPLWTMVHSAFISHSILTASRDLFWGEWKTATRPLRSTCISLIQKQEADNVAKRVPLPSPTLNKYFLF